MYVLDLKDATIPLRRSRDDAALVVQISSSLSRPQTRNGDEKKL